MNERKKKLWIKFPFHSPQSTWLFRMKNPIWNVEALQFTFELNLRGYDIILFLYKLFLIQRGGAKDLGLILTFLNLNNPQYIHTCSLQCLLSLRSTSENLKVCLFHFYFQSYIHFYGGWRDWNKFNMKIQTFSRWKTQYKGSVMFRKNSPLNWCFFIIIIIILVHQIIQKCIAN